MQILVVDDDRTFCRFLAELLASQGYHVDWASHALEGFKLAQRNFYDLFIIDVCMPLVSGIKLAEGLKEEFLSAKIILVSAFVDDSMKERAQQLGSALLGKPFTNDRVLALVANTAKALSPFGNFAQGTLGEYDNQN